MRNFSLTFTWFLVVVILAGCSSGIKSLVDEEPVYTSIFDLSENSFNKNDLNSIFLIESLKTAREEKRIEVIDEMDGALLFQYREGDREVLCTVSWKKGLNEKVTELTFNNRPISNTTGRLYQTANMHRGSLTNLPNVVQVYAEAEKLGSPCFDGIKSGDYLQMTLDANIELAGLYRASRSFVTDFLIHRILGGDSIEEYWQTDKQVYCILATKNGGNIMIWFDNGSLTISGDFEQRGDA